MQSKGKTKLKGKSSSMLTHKNRKKAKTHNKKEARFREWAKSTKLTKSTKWKKKLRNKRFNRNLISVSIFCFIVLQCHSFPLSLYLPFFSQITKSQNFRTFYFSSFHFVAFCFCFRCFTFSLFVSFVCYFSTRKPLYHRISAMCNFLWLFRWQFHFVCFLHFRFCRSSFWEQWSFSQWLCVPSNKWRTMFDRFSIVWWCAFSLGSNVTQKHSQIYS